VYFCALQVLRLLLLMIVERVVLCMQKIAIYWLCLLVILFYCFTVLVKNEIGKIITLSLLVSVYC